MIFSKPIRFCKPIATFICLLIVVGCASRATHNGDLEFLIKDLGKKAYIVNQFRAEFTKVKKSPIFSHDMIVKGNLTFQKENKFQLILSGDINVEILSDGQFVIIVHDGKDEEFYHVRGDRDRSKFSDPLMSIVNTITSGDLERFAKVKQKRMGNVLGLEILPGMNPEFENISDVLVEFNEAGTVQKVVINFKDGSRDTTIFQSWSMLTQDDPSITKMNEKLEQIARHAPSGILPGSTRLWSQAQDSPTDTINGRQKKPMTSNHQKEIDDGLLPTGE
ncbi:MAG: outer membrane lipoprotein carrier protein LolA [Syntrophaceae bacterium]|nr:outer membrane lipoprotein carrier protein LolA [Syntrophaceae bacterium]